MDKSGDRLKVQVTSYQSVNDLGERASFKKITFVVLLIVTTAPAPVIHFSKILPNSIDEEELCMRSR